MIAYYTDCISYGCGRVQVKNPRLLKSWLFVVVVVICLAPAFLMLVLFQGLIFEEAKWPTWLQLFSTLLLLLSLRLMPLWALGVYVLFLLASGGDEHLELVVEASRAAALYGLVGAGMTIKMHWLRLRSGQQAHSQQVRLANVGILAGVAALVLVALSLPRSIFSEMFIVYGFPVVGACLLLGVNFYYSFSNKELIDTSDSDPESALSLKGFGSRKAIVAAALMAVVIYVFMSVDIIHQAGDHVSKVVLAPYPTLASGYGGGEEGSPVDDLPDWYLAGSYIYLYESM